MGICINYNGTLDDPTRLDEVLDKIRDFCKAAGWECHEVSDHFSGVIGVPHEMMNHNPADGPRPDLKHIWDMTKRPPQLIEETVRGVLVVPPDTEWVRLKFDQRGRIVDYWEMTADQFIGGIAGETHYMALALFCKTAGPSFESSIDSHIGICALLKMLEPYMSNLHVYDEAEYYETLDTAKLHRDRAFMQGMGQALLQPGVMSAICEAAGIEGIPADAKVELGPAIEVRTVSVPKTAKNRPVN